MSEIILSGTIVAVLPQQGGVSQKSGQPWAKGSFVLQHEGGQYPKHVCFDVFGADKLQQWNIQQGEFLTVKLNIDAKMSQKDGRWFNEIRAWDVQRGQMAQQQPMQGYAPQPQYQQMPPQGYQQPMQYQQAAPAPFPQQAPVQQPAQGNLPFPPAQ